MAKGSHALSDLKRAYSAARGIPLRTAQDRAKKNHPDWLAFMAAMGAKAAKADAPTVLEAQALTVVQSKTLPLPPADADTMDGHIAPPALSKPRAMWAPEEYAECEAWTSMVEANKQRDRAIRGNDGPLAVLYVKVAGEAFKTYERARRNRVQAELESGKLRPMADWQQAKAAVQKMAALFEAMDGELAQAANPEDPSAAMKGIAAWKTRRWNPALTATMTELTLLPAA